jgi:hypothetical protein
MLLGSAPLWFAHLPPLVDYLGHLGRYHVELDLARSPALQRSWSFHWALIGNLGVDLLIIPLAHLFGLERAAWLIALALPPLMIWGIARMCRAIHGRLTPFAIAAAPFALAYPYQYGFVNYWLACALAFHVLASWVASGRTAPVRRAILFAPAAAAVWLAHAYGWAVLVVLVGSLELSRGWRRELRAWPAMARKILLHIWPVLLPALLMIAWRPGGGGAETSDFFNFGAKLSGFVRTLRDQNQWLDMSSVALASVLILWGCSRRRARPSAALSLATAAFLGLILLMPRQLFGSAFADVRLWPIAFITALTAIAPIERSSRVGLSVAGAALAIFALRMAVTALGFASYEQAYDGHLRALGFVQPGARIAVLVLHTRCDGWRQERVAHLSDIAIVRKDAFVNSQWEIPGGQLLTPLVARGSNFNSDPSQYVLPQGGCSADSSPALLQRIAKLPRDRFDYLWLLNFDTLRVALPGDFQRLYVDERSSLYAVGPAGRK